MESFGKDRREWLKDYIEISKQTPSHDTFERIMQNLDSESFRQAMQSITVVQKEELVTDLIAIDGKKLRGASPHTRGVQGIYILTAWACNAQQQISSLRIEDKTNEITQVPLLLDRMDIEDCTISIDAMGCQKEIAEKIRSKKGNYLLLVKDNQGELLEEIEESFSYAKINDEQVKWDYGHGRYEMRHCQVLAAKEYLSPKLLAKWKDVKSIVHVKSIRESKDTTSTESRYYISNRERNAEYFNTAIRMHWSIENKLHWNLDVILSEDKSRVRKDYSPENMNTLRKMVLQFLVQKKDKFSKKKRQFKAAMNTEYLSSLLSP